MNLFNRFISPGDLVFDVGANNGQMTYLYLCLGAKVVAIEPQSSCVGYLNTLYGTNDKVTIEPTALGEKFGTVELAVCNADSLTTLNPDKWASGRFKGWNWSRREQVTLCTLDGMIQKHGRPSYCKIDVEGTEEQVLMGLSLPIPAISFEHTQEFFDDIERCGNQLMRISPEYRFNFVAGEWGTPGMERWGNLGSLIDAMRNLRPDYWGNVYACLPGVLKDVS